MYLLSKVARMGKTEVYTDPITQIVTSKDRAMSEFHCRIYGEGGAEAQSTHLHIESDRIRLTDAAYANYHLPFDKVKATFVGSFPYSVQLSVDSENLTLVITELGILTELERQAAGTELADQATRLKQSLVKKHRSSRKQWLVVTGVIAAVPLIGLLCLDSFINVGIAQVDPKFEGRLGTWLAASEKFQREGPDQKRVQAIGQELVAHVDKLPYEFHFYVAKDDQVNACAYPGGLVVVNSALVDAASDDQLAGVIGHEIGHVLHRDTLRETLHNLGLGFSFSVFMHLIGLATDLGDLPGKQMSQLMESLESLRFSRGQETAADKEGVLLAMQAGYAGDGLVKFFEKEKAKNGHSGDVGEKLTGLLSTHPLDQERIEVIKAEIEKVKVQLAKEKKEKSK